MQQPLHTGRLALTPAAPDQTPTDLDALIAALREAGFIGERFADHPPRFLLGDRFLQLVTFMGCSPFIRLQPGTEDEPFCHLIIDGPSDRPRLLRGKNTSPPRCEQCRKRLPEWESIFAAWQTQPPGWLATCPHCGHAQDPATYDFRQSAGCGRLFLFVENIFPQEAVPSPTLLDRLQSVTDGQPWSYFYQQD